MLFKTILKDDFKQFANKIIEQNITIAPTKKNIGSSNEPVYQFKQVYSFDEIVMDYTKTYSSVKKFFLPYKENLSTFNFEKKRMGTKY